MFNFQKLDKQKEFFSNLPKATKKSQQGKFSLGKIALSLSYENLIVFGIGLIMLLIVCYSLGVERGKLLVQLRSEDILSEEKDALELAPVDKPPSLSGEEVESTFASTKSKPTALPYIQVASFRTEKYAGKEMEKLKHQGYQPFMTTSGKYKVVCVGGYKDKREAAQGLKQLKQIYSDCILRSK